MVESGIARVQLIIDTLARTNGIDAFRKKLQFLNKTALKEPSGFLDALSEIERVKSMNAQLEKLGLSFDNQGNITDTVTKKQISFGEALKLASKRQEEAKRKALEAKEAQKELNKAWNEAIAENKRFDAALKKTENRIKQNNEQLRRAKTSFFNFRNAMGALSIMFMGQKIERSMIRLMTTTVGAFTQITKSQSEAGQGLTALGANFTMLKFSIGNAIATALAPMIPTIIEIISNITNWIQENQGLTAGIIEFGSILGGLMATGGALILFISGIEKLGKFFATRLALKTIDTTALAKAGKSVDDFLAEGGPISNLKAGLALSGVVVGASLTLVSIGNLLSTEWNKDNLDIIFSNIIGELIGTTLLGGTIAVLAGSTFATGAAIAFAISTVILFNIMGYKLGAFEKMKDFLSGVKEKFTKPFKDVSKAFQDLEDINQILDARAGKAPLTGEMIDNYATQQAINVLTQNMQSIDTKFEETTSMLADESKWVPFLDVVKDVSEKTTNYNDEIWSSFQSIDNSISLLNDGTSTFLENEKKKQEALEETATAANEAAKALERYNRANNGSTESTQNTTSEYMIPNK